MTKREQIIDFIYKKYESVGFTARNYSPELGFSLTNYNSDTIGLFSVDSVDEAEDLVISFLSSLKKGNIFINDIYNENKELFLRVEIILPISS